MVFMLLSLLSVPASEALLFVSIVLNDGAPQPLDAILLRAAESTPPGAARYE